MNGRSGVIVILCLAATVGLCSCSSEGAEPPRGGVSTELEIELTNPYWRQLYPQHWPGLRIAYATAYDVARRKLVIYGGWRGDYPNVIYLNDTWEFDGTDWTEIQTAHRPYKGRSGVAMCYVRPWHKIIMFGGAGGAGGATDETWSYDGVDWTKLEPATVPDTRVAAAMAFDENLGKVLLFGGITREGAFYGACWLFDGTNWEMTDCGGIGPGEPKGRINSRMVWNPVSKRIVLFGGEFPWGNYWGDTWEFYDRGFHKVTTAVSATPRTNHGMTFHALSGKCLFFGGTYRTESGSLNICNDLWEYDGIDWREVPVRNPPSPRNYVTIEYCDASRSVYLYGGAPSAGLPRLEDTWKYSTVAEAPSLGPTATAIMVLLFTITLVPLTSRAIVRRQRSSPGPAGNGPPSVCICHVSPNLSPGRLSS